MKLELSIPCRLLTSIVALLFVVPVHADPCGMVPPIYTGPGSPISRIGLQQTYVFYKDGVEGIVIRPGFQGNVDNFGMLIPFPNPPALRKVPDDIFSHLEKAVDPPEVVVDLRHQFYDQNTIQLGASISNEQTKKLRFFLDEVKVLKKEAVGMYEIAVLAAGSANALKKWMDENGFQYPEGMDSVCEDYIKEDWCFVAVKTKVGSKSSADAKPGLREADTSLPAGSVFDGHVQAMGFRFKTDELVVPMRLSAFNEGSLRNVVYLLTDEPKKVRSIPEEYVVRQISGNQLYENVATPLPLRIIGGTKKDIPEWRQKTLDSERNPTPHNGFAKLLFASDLIAKSSTELSLAHEETEKALLEIGEHFGLRGNDIDKVNAEAIKKEIDEVVAEGIKSLQEMTLTVVDGDFPREVLAGQNLTFAEYQMPKFRNNSEHYDATRHGPGEKKLSSRFDFDPQTNTYVETKYVARRPFNAHILMSMMILAALISSIAFSFIVTSKRTA